jgi:hypothetical protein
MEVGNSSGKWEVEERLITTGTGDRKVDKDAEMRRGEQKGEQRGEGGIYGRQESSEAHVRALPN